MEKDAEGDGDRSDHRLQIYYSYHALEHLILKHIFF